MGIAVARLTDLIDSNNCYDVPLSELLSMQLDAANERLDERRGAIKLLAHRAETSGVQVIKDRGDLIPLLFAHTAYKSYPENWFVQGKWDRMGRWLDTITYSRIPKIDTSNVRDIDDWIGLLAATGHFLSCSSGTTGKCSIIPAVAEDRAWARRQMPRAMTWATGIAPTREYKMFSLSPLTQNFRAPDSRQSLIDAFAHSYEPFPGPGITVGSVSKMVALRRAIADGTAPPGEIAAFEDMAAQRQKAIDEGVTRTAEAIVANRGQKILFQGLLATMFRISEIVREVGYSGKDFKSENALCTGGGLKGTNLPADFRERLAATFNIQPEKTYYSYSMQEIGSVMPLCKAGRYHAPPWVIILVLDQPGEQLMPTEKDGCEGRAAFFDLSLEGRWGGLISGDKVHVDYAKCACGHHGPTVGREIVRYSDLPGGDKISCAGTIDAYIRGAG